MQQIQNKYTQQIKVHHKAELKKGAKSVFSSLENMDLLV